MTSARWIAEAEAALAQDLELQEVIRSLELALPEERRPIVRSLARSCYMAGHSTAKAEVLQDLERRGLQPRPEPKRPRWRALLARLRPW